MLNTDFKLTSDKMDLILNDCVLITSDLAVIKNSLDQTNINEKWGVDPLKRRISTMCLDYE